ncbi:MazG-like family protein [Rothia sp. LK2588]|uniref:MazG-like family protein n=1 Tax=Rothia sp. LK2588 TaxID=3114369 RepID=UPI0034CEE9D9
MDTLSKSISIEANELLELSQWEETKDFRELSNELADVFIYCILLAEYAELDIKKIIQDKLAINAEKYPEVMGCECNE